MAKKDTNNIELVVFNCFIRTIKTDGKYMMFRRGVRNKGIMNYLINGAIKSPRDPSNPFQTVSTTDEVIKTLVDITDKMAKSNGKKNGIKELDKYEHVTITINHLLHFFMETNGLSMDKLCSLGEEIYSLSCNKLFGDTIEEVEQRQQEEIANIRDAGQMKAKLFQDFVKAIKDETISKNKSFDDYLREHAAEFEAFSHANVRDDMNVGHVLGRVPDDDNYDNMFLMDTLVDRNTSTW